MKFSISSRYKIPALVIASLVMASIAGWLIGSHFMLGAVAVAGLLGGLLVFFYPETAFIASLGTIVIGQLIRIPIGASEILPNDVLLPMLIVAWTLRRLASGHWTLRKHSLTLPVALMVLIMGLSLVVNHQRATNELFNGALYLIRWLEYAALFWIGMDMFRTRERAQRYLGLLVWIGVLLAGLGFVQLKLFPDFTFMVPQGWDPHIGRLLSTWFDPNYLGGLFVLCIALTVSVALYLPFRQARWWWAAAMVLLLATLLTYSRSAYVGLVVALGSIGLVRSRVALFVGGLALISAVLFVPRIQERVIGIRSLDVTAQYRLVSYENAATVIRDYPILGVGYNVYKYVQVEYHFLTKTDEHSASGSDSSLLTIWVTTGTVGLIVYCWVLLAMLRELWKTWRDRSLPKYWQGFGLGAIAGFLGLLAHSQFVNGFQYPHLMEYLWLMVAMAIAVRQPSTTLEK